MGFARTPFLLVLLKVAKAFGMHTSHTWVHSHMHTFKTGPVSLLCLSISSWAGHDDLHHAEPTPSSPPHSSLVAGKGNVQMWASITGSPSCITKGILCLIRELSLPSLCSVFQSSLYVLLRKCGPGVVAQACDPNCLGGRGRRMESSRPAWAS